MILTLLLAQAYSFSGLLESDSKPDYFLQDAGNNSLGWISKDDSNKEANKTLLVEYDAIKKSITLNGKKICVDSTNSTVKFCDNNYVFSRWETDAEDGKFKFRTESDLCLSVGKKDKSFNSAIVTTCKAQNKNQRFQYEKDTEDRIETIKNDYDEGGVVLLKMTLKAYNDDVPVEIIVHDDKDGNKRINSTIGELKSLINTNTTAETLNHDVLVDSTKRNMKSK
ncbi:ricin B lectin (RBL3c) [Vairimorpha necatrix]|uniref:Ricin B lectin (RBL3c) n=1 Tax=Vairimorpha necatrix TaxID=6039 RepID=A0AAX4J8U9_9MICR